MSTVVSVKKNSSRLIFGRLLLAGQFGDLKLELLDFLEDAELGLDLPVPYNDHHCPIDTDQGGEESPGHIPAGIVFYPKRPIHCNGHGDRNKLDVADIPPEIAQRRQLAPGSPDRSGTGLADLPVENSIFHGFFAESRAYFRFSAKNLSGFFLDVFVLSG